jgi:hypothetical protein
VLQAVILLLFNEKDKYTFSEIQEATSLPEDETKRYLISLSCGKAKVHPNAAVACIDHRRALRRYLFARNQVLRKGTKGPTVENDEPFQIDWKFKDKYGPIATRRRCAM